MEYTEAYKGTERSIKSRALVSLRVNWSIVVDEVQINGLVLEVGEEN